MKDVINLERPKAISRRVLAIAQDAKTLRKPVFGTGMPFFAA
ncbi:MAG: hypothetical protein R2864_05165 [Syntrophotaleaceae bacterium]